MKNLFLLILMALSLYSCTLQSVALRGQYLDKPFEITTNRSFDSVWSSTIDLFAQKGISIKIIDKSSGLIVSEKTSFLNNYSFEDVNGGIENPNAWVAINKYKIGSVIYKPQKLTGEWNVRIKSNGVNTTSININLTNIEGSYHQSAAPYVAELTLNYQGKSTGNFERSISELLR